jgi:hypothetical protein
MSLSILLFLWASLGSAQQDLEVSSIDGLTTISVALTSGDLTSISSPGHAPLPFSVGSGSFIGFNATASTVSTRVYPNVMIAPCDATSYLQQFTLLPSGRILTGDATHCLDVWNCGVTNGTVVDLYPCSYAATCGDPARTLNELFSLDVSTGELRSLLTSPNPMCVSVFGGAGPTVDLWECTGGVSQKWAYDAATKLFSSVGNAGMCLSAPPGPVPPPPPPPPCVWQGSPTVSGGGSGGAPIVVTRNASCLAGAATVLVTDTYAPSPTSVSWATVYTVVEATSPALPAFTVPLGASLRTSTDGSAPPLSLWTTWTRGCVDNGPGMCFGEGAWQEPFTPLPLDATSTALFRLGNRDFGEIYAPFGTQFEDSITVPLVTLLRPGDDFGATLLLSPQEPLLELLLRVAGGRVDLVRMLRRLSLQGEPVAVTAHLRAHASDWRPALQLLLDEHPALVLPHASHASEFDGLGGYSWQAPVNASYAAEVGFKTNWELSGTFMPYDGLFAPYQSEWLNLGPINAGLPQYNVTYEKIAAFDASVQAAGLNSLTYFDIGNWGVSIDTSKTYANLTCGVRPGGLAAPCPTPEGSNAYLAHYLSAALLDNGWSPSGGFFRGAKGDWVGTTLMDPSEPFFEDLLLEQLQMRMTTPSAQGIAIDRFDYTAYYSLKRDDGVSWIPQGGGGWGPGQSLLNSHIHTYSRMAAALRADSPELLMLGNCNTLCRIDVGGIFDGGFSEGAALNAVAWLGLRRPSILWTYSLDNHSPQALDAFFQQHITMRVFPMAPMPANDHSINPGSPLVQQAYKDYAPLFLALRGVEWVLDAVRPVAVLMPPPTALSGSNSGGSGGGIQANIFRAMGTSSEPVVQGQLLVVLTLAPTGTNATTLKVSGQTLFGAATAMNAFSLVPGAGQVWQPMGSFPVAADFTTTVTDVPLLRGCSMIKLTPMGSSNTL